jgi:hypothetical protein
METAVEGRDAVGFALTAFERQLAELDEDTLFRHIPSQTTALDRRSLLGLHLAWRRGHRFTYLEIGSHLGGSLQALVVDPLCERIISIDARPLSVPDERIGPGDTQSYEGNSTARMLALLGAVPGADVRKVHTIDAGTDQLDPSTFSFRPDLCFIDGEHTDHAVLRDARFCLSVVNPDGCIVFHDANVIYRGVNEFIRHDLIEPGRSFRAYVLPHAVFVIELGMSRLHECAEIRSMLENNYQAYLVGLMANDHFREIALHPVVLFLRKVRLTFIKYGANLSAWVFLKKRSSAS